MTWTPLQANPRGGTVIHGAASIGAGHGGNLQIHQSSRNAIIQWESFSIDSGELTQFRQSGSDAAVLNRVTGGDPSAIHGALKANGNVFVVNPNGILVGPGGTIDVHGLVLSTLDVSDGEFLARGDMVFKGNGNSGGVTNLGRINAIGGDVFLIGRTVVNSGTVRSEGGRVGLAAGEEVLLKADDGLGGERIFVRAKGSGVSGTGIYNDGSIEGAAVELKAHGNIYALAINNKGSIRATGATNRGGRVYLHGAGGMVNNRGSIQVSSSGVGSGGRALIEAAYAKVDGMIRAEGGSVRVAATEKVELSGKVDVSGERGHGGGVVIEAPEIEMVGGSLVDASGAGGGGSIRIGGGFQGRDTEVSNAQRVLIDDGAVLRADALDSGRGGRVIVWSDGDTEFGGHASAEGVDRGGLVEVSGKDTLLYEGMVSTLATHGQAGTLLLDPTNFTILSGTASSAANQIGSSTLEAQLAGGNVVITTATAGSDEGDIIVADGANVVWDGDTSLSLLAHRHLAVGASLQNSGGGALNLVAGWDGSAGFASAPASGGEHPDPVSFSLEDLLTAGGYGVNGGMVRIGDGNQTAGIAAGSRNGATTVLGHGVELLGGTASTAFAQIGYRPTAVDQDTGGSISLRTRAGGLSVLGGSSTGAYAQIGHGGRGSVGDSLGGAIQLISSVPSDLLLAAGSRNSAYAQIGHGGDSVKGSAKGGAIDLEAFRHVTFTGGSGSASNAYAQIGHGGHDSDSALSGGISLTGLTGDVIISGGTSSSKGTYAQIGHGGRSHDGDRSGNIVVETTDGEISLRGAAENAGGDAYAQIGHGGRSSSGNLTGDSEGDVTVRASGDISITAGQGAGGNERWAQIGHGSIAAAAGDYGGEIRVVSSDGNVVLQGGARQNAYAVIGHGGRNATGDHEGSITVRAAGSVLGTAGTGLRTGVMIGHGGSNGGNSATPEGNSGTISVAALGGDVIFQAGQAGSSESSAMIGHGGDVNRGDHSGDVVVRAGGTVRMEAGEGTRAYAQIGHGGYDADGNHSGDVVVSAGSGVLGTALGTGLFDDLGDLDGDGEADLVQFSAPASGAGTVEILSGSADEAYAMVGHGGRSSGNASSNASTMDGHVAVSAHGNIELRGGTATRSFAQIGHGGYETAAITFTLSGDVSVVSQTGMLSVLAGGGGESGAMVGHGTQRSSASNNSLGSRAGHVYIEAGSWNIVGNDVNGAGIGHRSGSAGNGVVADQRFTMVAHGRDGSIVHRLDGAFFALLGMQDHLAAGGDASFAATGDLLVDLPLSYASHGALNLLATGDLAVGQHLQNAGSGDISVVAGWDGASGMDLASQDFLKRKEVGAFGLATFLSDAPTWGSAGGKVVVGGGSQTAGVAVGSAGGSTTVLGHAVALTGGGTTNAYAQIGFRPTAAGQDASGAIELRTRAGGLSVLGGSEDGAYAQIGHGGRLSAASTLDGTIRVTSALPSDLLARAGSGNNAYAQIGHGGEAVKTSAKSGSITLDSFRHVTLAGGSGAVVNAYAQIGHGGRDADGALSGAVSLLNLTGDVALQGGSGTTGGTYAQIGHGGREHNGARSGVITVATTEGGISLKGGTAEAGLNTYAMIGHGGRDFSGNSSDDISVTASGDISLVAGQGAGGNERWAQIGHGGIAASSGNYSGAVTVVSSDGNVVLQGGERQNGYAHIGHGGRNTTGDHEGSITVRAAGSVLGRAGAGPRTGVMIGHGGSNGSNPATPEGNLGDIHVTAQGGDIVFLAGSGSESSAQIGHGGHLNDGDHGGAITVTSAGTIEFRWSGTNSAPGNLSYAQLGHGGIDATGNHDGAIHVRAASDILFRGTASTTSNRNNNYVQLGHGGANAAGSHGGSIAVVSSGGAITFEAGSSGGGNRYAQLGHGGVEAVGDHSGDIAVQAWDTIRFNRGAVGAGNYAQLGHGGRGAVALSGHSGRIGVASRNGGIFFTGTGGGSNVADQSYGQLGHGGYAATGNHEGDIVVRAMNNLEFRTHIALGSGSYAQLGHGGMLAAGDHAGNITVSSQIAGNYTDIGDFNGDGVIDAADAVLVSQGSATGGMRFISNGAANDAYVQLGHGGRLARGGHSGDIAVDSHRVVVFVANQAGDRGYAQLGHGGHDAAALDEGGAAAPGNSGDISLTSRTGSVEFRWTGGSTATSDGTYVQLGHGGHLSSGIIAGGNNTGDIMVNAGTNLLFRSTNSATASTGNYAQLGHGGLRWNGNHRGDIDVLSASGIAFAAGALARSYAQLGHGGHGAAGSHSGSIAVQSVTGGITFSGGNSPAPHTDGVEDDRYAQLGHGGARAIGDHSGDIAVQAQGSIVFTRGLRGVGNYVQLGHGGRGAAALSGHSGRIGVASRNGTILFSGVGETDDFASESYGQLGHGGYAATGNHEGDIVVRAMNNLEFRTHLHLGSGSYAQLGHGGMLAAGDHAGNITVSSQIAGNYTDIGDFNGDGILDADDAVAVGAGSSGSGMRFISNGAADDAYVQLGHGGRLARGGHSGDIAVDSHRVVVFVANQAGARGYAQLGHGGHDAAALDGGPGAPGNSGDISLTSRTGSVEFRWTGGSTATSDGTYVQLGHGGHLSNGVVAGGDNTGDIMVNAGTDLLFRSTNSATASTGNYAQLGHGGLRWNGNHDGAITARAGTAGETGAIQFLAGTGGSDRYAQLGHGGSLALGDHGAADDIIQVDALGDIVFVAGSTRSYAQLGNGGHGAKGASSGTIQVTGEGRVTFIGGNGGDAFAQLGHGGHDADGLLAGDVSVEARGDVIMSGGTSSSKGTYAQIGHGGRSHDGDRSGNIVVETTDGEISLRGAAENAGGDAYAQIGHGGRSSSGNLTGDSEGNVTVRASGDIRITAGQGAGGNERWAQIGHGSIAAAAGDYGGEIRVVSSGGDVVLLGGARQNAYAVIGHGGRNATGDHEGSITVRAAGSVLGTAGTGLRTGVMIGHGGSNGGNSATPEGNSGTISVAALGGDVIFQAGQAGSSESWAMIGHGGDANRGDHSGDVVVRAGGTVQMEAGEGTRAYAQIGHGGYDADGNHSGDVVVSAGSGVLGTSLGTGLFDDLGDLDGDGEADLVRFSAPTSGAGTVEILSGSADEAYAMVGHGGRSSGNASSNASTMDGHVAVSAHGNIELRGGTATRSFAQIGHGGYETAAITFTLSGDVSVVSQTGMLSVLAGGGEESGAMVGHGTQRSSASNNSLGSRAGHVYIEAGSWNIVGNDVNGAGIGHRSGSAGNGVVADQRFTMVAHGRDGSVSHRLDASASSYLGAHDHLAAGGDVSFAAVGDLAVNVSMASDSAAEVNLLASGDLRVGGSIQNGGVGNVSVVGGWDGTTGMEWSPLDFLKRAQQRSLDVSAVLSEASAWGQRGGSVVIGGGSQPMVSAVGTTGGTTTVLGYAVDVIGGNFNGSRHAQIGTIPKGDVSQGGDIVVKALEGGVSVVAGSAVNSYAQIGHRVLGTMVTDLSSGIVVDSGGGLRLEGGGAFSSAQIGHGGAVATAGSIAGDIDVTVAQDIDLTGGTGVLAYAQIGHGGFSTDAEMAGKVTVEAGGSISLSAPHLFGEAAYAKIGHGDDLVGSFTYAAGTGGRSGDIEVSAGGDLSMAGAMIGHVNAYSVATASGSTQIGVGRGAPSDPTAGDLVTDDLSELSGAGDLRLYLARRGNNQIAPGTLLNGESYAGAWPDPWPSQGEDEYAIHLVDADMNPLPGGGDHTGGFGTGFAPVTLAGYAFYYDTISLGASSLSAPVAPAPGRYGALSLPPVDPTTAVDPDDPTQWRGARPSDDPTWPGHRLLDDRSYEAWLRSQQSVFDAPGTTSIRYEGYHHYGPNGESIFDFNNAPGGGGLR